MNIVEMHAIIHGRVQGVFFRDTTQRKAASMGITGTVKNLPDGTVEIVAVGEKENLEALVRFLSGNGGPGHVEKTDLEFRESTQPYDGFQVVF